MSLVLNYEMNRVKNGWSARCPAVGLTAHGYSEEVARKNLEYTIRLFLAPFERNGTLAKELQALGLDAPGAESPLEITLR